MATEAKQAIREELSLEAGILANELLNPEYDNDKALDEAQRRYEAYREYLEQYKKSLNQEIPC